MRLLSGSRPVVHVGQSNFVELDRATTIWSSQYGFLIFILPLSFTLLSAQIPFVTGF
ncbi:hypothetical protein PCAR4_350109 [Paraburkholderia caribensis]|nr:hypothetical protein PCAR4_350109 [Paraburkholderia caribensis]